VQDIDVGRQESKERRTPAKKNRLNLATTEEEEDVASGSRTPSYSPPLGTSPPHEVKIRQISRGVEDLTWQNGVKNIISEDDAPQIVVESDAKAVPEIHAQAPTEVTDASDEDTKTPPEDGTDVLTPPVDDGAADGDDEVVDDQTGQALSEVGEKEKGVKRKYSARITSGNILNVEPTIEQLKRPRDDSDKDDNPRETKRPSPPPESEPTPVQSPSPAPKLVWSHQCFVNLTFDCVSRQDLWLMQHRVLHLRWLRVKTSFRRLARHHPLRHCSHLAHRHPSASRSETQNHRNRSTKCQKFRRHQRQFPYPNCLALSRSRVPVPHLLLLRAPSRHRLNQRLQGATSHQRDASSQQHFHLMHQAAFMDFMYRSVHVLVLPVEGHLEVRWKGAPVCMCPELTGRVIVVVRRKREKIDLSASGRN
jgi:hypothetical protein